MRLSSTKALFLHLVLLIPICSSSGSSLETYVESSDSVCDGDYTHIDFRDECELAAFLLGFQHFEEVETAEFSSGCHM